jgi:menaquinone-dependent protoporphyrinogen oxidase
MARILVAYVSQKGSTAEIARAIAKELQAAGKEAEAKEMWTVASLEGYDAVIIGGPVYIGRVGGVGKFVKKHRGELSKLPVAAFAVGLAPASNDTEGIAWDQKGLRAAIGPLRPVAEAVFAGKLDPAKLSWLQRWMVKKAKSPVGDFRDWAAIAAWARELPGKMGL